MSLKYTPNLMVTLDFETGVLLIAQDGLQLTLQTREDLKSLSSCLSLSFTIH